MAMVYPLGHGFLDGCWRNCGRCHWMDGLVECGRSWQEHESKRPLYDQLGALADALNELREGR